MRPWNVEAFRPSDGKVLNHGFWRLLRPPSPGVDRRRKTPVERVYDPA
ncbi:hypothetical protein [Kyrpidia tusciae]|uniref:Uncharacterized protein n=1 Tax=Kyrpidia tusciae (strain DSM 2912 / NBRC 15312 / T2) TaxID=562970 RepID=D5WWD5_KYRT2|nr:hypothetical protein [Kyrpidia tusciae]ADG07700.1 hypothetical protein Btus_3085 [Kyrpidia tusciae DSM 2912]